MTDTILLKDLLGKSEFKLEYIFEQLGLSRQGFYNKVNGKTEFTASEIEKLSRLLKMSVAQRKQCFFS